MLINGLNKEPEHNSECFICLTQPKLWQYTQVHQLFWNIHCMPEKPRARPASVGKAHEATQAPQTSVRDWTKPSDSVDPSTSLLSRSSCSRCTKLWRIFFFSQNQTQPIPVDPLQSSMAGQDQCTDTVCCVYGFRSSEVRPQIQIRNMTTCTFWFSC